MNNIRIQYRGECPYTGMTKSIEVVFATLYIAEVSALQYKKMGFFCDDIDSCTCLDEHGACPLFIQASAPY